MKWTPQLGKAPSRKLEEWKTNAEVYEAWIAHVKKRGAKNTQRNLITYVGVFIAMFHPLVTTLERADIEKFVERISTKCARLMVGKRTECRGNRFDIQVCPLLAGQTGALCAGYKPLDPAGVWSYVCAINRFYDWLLVEGRIVANPALGVMRDYMANHALLFQERRNKPRRRNLVNAEISKLIKSSPLHHGIAYMVMAKCFLRIHEVLKLSWEPQYCDLEEGWMDIPRSWELGDKRQGNRRIIVDARLKYWVLIYRKWWENTVKRDAEGNPVTQRFLITCRGRPWGSNAGHNLNTALHANAVNAELMDGSETEREDRVNSHCFRAYATTDARCLGAPFEVLQTMRGDLAPGSIQRYDDYIRRLPDLYRRYGPRLDV